MRDEIIMKHNLWACQDLDLAAKSVGLRVNKIPLLFLPETVTIFVDTMLLSSSSLFMTMMTMMMIIIVVIL